MLKFNPYVIILGAFTATGIAATIYGWIIIARAKKSRRWPSTEGVIESSKRGMEDNDLLPEIVFSYTVDGRSRTQTQQFPKDLTPDKEFTDSYLTKYPAGARVSVYYDPGNPDRATLETGFMSGDWMVFALGLGMAVFGFLFLFFGGG